MSVLFRSGRMRKRGEDCAETKTETGRQARFRNDEEPRRKTKSEARPKAEADHPGIDLP
jgi:hypothetical protein